MSASAEPILPRVDDLSRPFWDGCAAGELRLQACRPSGHLRYPISAVCPRCLSPEYDWRALSGEGEVLSWVVFHRDYHPAWRDRIPYNVVLVQLREGPRMFGNVEPLGAADLAVGDPVRVTFAPASDEPGSAGAAVAIPRWTIDRAAGRGARPRT